MDKGQMREMIDVAMANGADFAELFLEEKDTTTIKCEKSKIEKVSVGTDRGIGIRVIKGEHVAYGYTNDFDKTNLLKIAQTLAQGVKSDTKGIVLDFEKTLPVRTSVEIDPKEVAVEDKIEAVKIADQSARELDEAIVQAVVTYSDTMQRVEIANSLGIHVEEERIRTRMAVNSIAQKGSDIQTGFASFGGTQGFESVKENDPIQLAKEASTRAINLLNAKPCPGGKMTVVLAEEAGGTMVHEACGHGLEGDLVRKGMSVYKDKLGEMVASPLITVVDDATLSRKYGSYYYDDEGAKGRCNVLIENGELKQYLYDYHTAKKEGTESTANGRRESYRVKPIARMSNTMILPGKDKKEDIIKSVKQGLLVTKMGGGQVSSITGDYVFDVAEGYMIENGEIAYGVRGATLAGNGPESLKQVEMVGDDLGFAIGTCGKGGQSAPVADAQPTLKINNLVVGGTADYDIKRK